jgi:hypothetical protein
MTRKSKDAVCDLSILTRTTTGSDGREHAEIVGLRNLLAYQFGATIWRKNDGSTQEPRARRKHGGHNGRIS